MTKAIKIQTKDLLTEYNMMKTQMTAMGEKALKLAFDVSKDLEKLVIRGYTPSFNDGEPCVHSQDYNFVINSFFTEGYDLDSGDESEEECPLKPLELEVVKELVNSDLVSNFLVSKFETDFTVTVTKGKNGDLKYEREYYSCD